MKDYELIKSQKVYEGKIIDVVNDVICLPDGKEVVREVVLHADASAVIPIDEDGKIIFVRQYRHPAKTLTLEIPAGVFDDGEDAKYCAQRELEEEIGYKTTDIKFLTKMYSSIGFSTELLYIYLAENLIKTKQNLDDEEFISIERYSLAEAIEMIFNGEIIDGKTMVAIFAYKHILENKK